MTIDRLEQIGIEISARVEKLYKLGTARSILTTF